MMMTVPQAAPNPVTPANPGSTTPHIPCSITWSWITTSVRCTSTSKRSLLELPLMSRVLTLSQLMLIPPFNIHMISMTICAVSTHAPPWLGHLRLGRTVSLTEQEIPPDTPKPRTRQPSKKNWKAPHPFFGWLAAGTIEKTFGLTA